MGDEVVLDASIAAKCFFEEPGQDAAIALVLSGRTLLAPELIFAEVASLAAKKVRRSEVAQDVARDAVNRVGELLSEVAPISGLAAQAFDYAVGHGFSAYDSLYLALAKARGARLATADDRLAARATQVGLGDLIWRAATD